MAPAYSFATVRWRLNSSRSGLIVPCIWFARCPLNLSRLSLATFTLLVWRLKVIWLPLYKWAIALGTLLEYTHVSWCFLMCLFNLVTINPLISLCITECGTPSGLHPSSSQGLRELWGFGVLWCNHPLSLTLKERALLLCEVSAFFMCVYSEYSDVFCNRSVGDSTGADLADRATPWGPYLIATPLICS